ncbi:MAG TPA: hypothetical protein VFA63_04630 [Pseudonocardiaceae bacterium]|nr:hypothetical protein [Pseudonocardiaceae bacterium]
MSLTPIYDQLRGERINADVPPADIRATDSEPMPLPRRRSTGEVAQATPLFSRPPDAPDGPGGVTVTSARQARSGSR